MGIWKIIDEAHLNNIVIKKDFRGNGFSKILLQYIIDFCKNNGTIKLLTLEVHEDNLIAQKLYSNFGFKIVGKRKNYYEDKTGIIMTLNF